MAVNIPRVSLSIIILTYNRSEALTPILYSLARQKITPQEVVISDDGSGEDHKSAIEKHLMQKNWPFKIKYIWHPDTGFAASRARNMGAAQSSGDYIIFIDGDCVPRQDFVSMHLYLRKSGCFINGSRILLDEELTNHIIGHPEISANSALFWFRQRMAGHVNKWLPTAAHIPRLFRSASSAFQWKGIRSCNFSLWREDFVRINGFDESFVGWGHEDADFVWRLHRAGCQRINGHWSTEVLHLWHKEASRDRESANAKRLRERMTNSSAGYVATMGIREAAYDDCELIYTN